MGTQPTNRSCVHWWLYVHSYIATSFVCSTNRIWSQWIYIYTVYSKKNALQLVRIDRIRAQQRGATCWAHVICVCMCITSPHVVSSEASDVLVRIEVTSCTDGIASVTPRQWITKTSGRAQGHHIQRSQGCGNGGVGRALERRYRTLNPFSFSNFICM